MADSNGTNGHVNGTSSSNGLAPVKPLPTNNLTKLQPGLSLLEPLSRYGKGPGVIIVVPDAVNDHDTLAIKEGVPSVAVKWAEEGYVVAQITQKYLDANEDSLRAAVEAIARCKKCDAASRQGLIVYDGALWNRIAAKLDLAPAVVGAVIYTSAADASSLTPSPIPTIQHLAGKPTSKPVRSEDLTQFDYPTQSSPLFATPFTKAFNYAAEAVSHTRNLTLLKREIDGPHFDLEAIWDEHTQYEFDTRSVAHTMATMVAEPYVNHIPTLTGGIGRAPLSDFYAHHFIFKNPADTELELISRTVGIDRVIDEFIFKFKHDSVIDWLIPGVPPTQKRIEVPFTAVVNIRGDRLYHEHIAWDQSSVLRQLGVLPEVLPWPYAHPEGKTAAPGKKWGLKLPVAGVATAEKMRDKNAVASNGLFEGGLVEMDA